MRPACWRLWNWYGQTFDVITLTLSWKRGISRRFYIVHALRLPAIVSRVNLSHRFLLMISSISSTLPCSVWISSRIIVFATLSSWFPIHSLPLFSIPFHGHRSQGLLYTASLTACFDYLWAFSMAGRNFTLSLGPTCLLATSSNWLSSFILLPFICLLVLKAKKQGRTSDGPAPS